MIRVSHLTKKYGSFTAVDNISFEVERGGVIGFLGPNGAGKTTTIRILTCYMPATSGSASIGGADVFTNSMSVRQRIGYLPESAPMYPEMRVREYLTFRGRLRGMAHKQRQHCIEAVSERCWLREFIDRPIGQLSKGMKQRVGLADAIMHDPDVVILDEPTAGLDPSQIRETRRLIKELGDNHTVLFSSHILSEVEQICSRMMIIAGGHIVAQGTLQELRQHVSSRSSTVAEIKCSADSLNKKAKAIYGVSNVQVDSSDGWQRLTIETHDGADPRESVFQLCKDNDWPLRELRRDGGSLEDFFIQVTGGKQRESVTAESP